MIALKCDGNGSIIEQKARLVAKGYTQIPGVDFFVMYALVVRHESLRINLAIGTVLDYKIWQIDYASVYLNVLTHAPILIEQLGGYAKRPSEIFEIDLAGGQRVRGSDDADRNVLADRWEWQCK